MTWTYAAVAQEAKTDRKGTGDLPAGHSGHGEAFNEGPRQKAFLMGGTGKVDFPVSTENSEAQAFFTQGVGQLHGFWYFEAERSFRQVAALDPDCAMAYWGMAMANDNNDERARGFIKEAVRRIDAADPREALWIEGRAEYLDESTGDRKKRRQNYLRSLEEIIHEYPDDIEAKAFLAVYIWKFKSDLPIPSHEAVDALLAQIFAVEPMHPAHHYKIHLWDREKPERALPSAARSGQSSPSIAHQWHMSGHIFSRLKRYADAAWQQEASARVDHRQMERDRVLPDQITNFAHNNEWLTRNLSHIGRVHDGIALTKNMIELPRHPKYNTLEMSGRSASYGRARLFELLERYELWDELIALSKTVYLEETNIKQRQRRRLRALGAAHFAKGNHDELQQQIAALKTHVKELRGERKGARKKAVEEAREKNLPREEIHKARLAAVKPFGDDINGVKNMLLELRAYRDLLLDANDAAIDKLANVKGLDDTRLAQLYFAAGRPARAIEMAKSAVDEGEGEVIPLANYADLLDRDGQHDAAASAFEKLRELSAAIDLDTPPFVRLKPIARRLGLPEDWRVERPVAEDVGERPELASLGPFRWSPPEAPPWRLPSDSGELVSLSDYLGKPVIVIFYLGYGCLHCIEQLTTFAPRTGDFKAAGVDLVAVSTDSKEELQKSLKTFAETVEGAFPFPLVADPDMEIFKRYRAYDDFENQPLHGTFLLDAEGKVLWQDVSFEPFTDADFLISEAERLLVKPRSLSGRF